MALTELEQLKLQRLKLQRQKLQQQPMEPQDTSVGLTEQLSSSAPPKSSGDPVIDMLINIQKEYVGPLAQGANVGFFGIPKVAAKAIGGEDFAKQMFAEQSTLPGKVARFGASAAGLLGGGAAKLSQAVGQRLMPSTLGKVGLSLAGGKVGAAKGALLANKITRGAIEGAVFGGTQLDALGTGEVSLGGQLGQAATGATFGAAFPLVTAGGGKIARSIKKFRTPTKTSPAPGLLKRAKEAGEARVLTLKEQAKIATSEIDDAIKEAGLLKKKTLFKNKVEFKKKLQETTQSLKKNVEAMDDALQVESEEAAFMVQKKLPEFYRSNSKAFGSRLDEISERLAQSGDDVTIGEIDDSLNRIVADMDDALIVDGTPRSAIQALGEKYALKFKETADGIISNANQRVTLKTFFNDIKSIRNSLSAGAKSGASRYTQEDVAVSIFNNHMGGLLETRAPELIKLREAYTPVIQAMKASNRIFKPFKGRFDTKAGTSFLKKLALEQTEAGEVALVQAIEQGGGFAEGIGPITPKLRTLGNDMKLARSRIQPILNEMKDANLLFREGLDRKFYEQIQNLTTKKKFINANSVIKEKLIGKTVEKRLTEIGIRKNIISNLTKDRNKMLAFIRNALLVTGAGAAGVGMVRGLSQK